MCSIPSPNLAGLPGLVLSLSSLKHRGRCVDFRRINAVTLRDQYPLPLIDDIFDQVVGCAVYSTLDLRAGYHQIKMAEEDIPKTAFRCHLGLFEYTRMPFGLANAPAVFQRTMDTVLAGLLGKCVFVYLDDLCVYSSSLDLHERHLQAVFDRLEEAGLRLKPSKCHFELPEVRLWGLIISRDGKRPDPEKNSGHRHPAPPPPDYPTGGPLLFGVHIILSGMHS